MSTTFTPARIAELRALAEVTTKRPWRDDISDCNYGQPRIYGDGRLIAVVGNAEPDRCEQWRHDALFATAACNEILPAIDEIERLRGLLWFAWNEFNAIRARSGAPLTRDGMTTCDETLWSEMTDKFGEAIGERARTPWPSEEAARWTLAPEAERLRAENEKLREALKPFARADRAIGDEPGPYRFETGAGYRLIDRESLRRARRAFEGGDA